MPPIGRSRVEIRLIRLLARCEEMASADNPADWRLENYVGTLEERLLEVQRLTGLEKPKEDTIREYCRKIQFLKQLLETEKIPETAKKSLANQLLAPSKIRTIPSKVDSPTGKQIQIQASTRYGSEMRDELLRKRKDDGTRQRNTAGISNEKDADAILKLQQKMHEKIADEMVALTRNLKHNVSASNRVIKEDISVIDKSTKQTDSNYNRLQHESNRLESHLKHGTNWWLWISLVCVCVVFLFMIFFIRFFPK